MNSLLIALMLLNGIEVGGRIGAAFPGGGLGRRHEFAGVFGGFAAGRVGPGRLELSYGFAEFAGPRSSDYSLQLHSVGVEYGLEVLQRSTWGIEVGVGAGYGFARRRSGSASESGGAPAVRLVAGLVQHQERSRVGLDLDSSIYLEYGAGGVRPAWFFGLRAGVGHVL